MQGQRRIFEQPLSLQRYLWVAENVAEDPSISSVTDLGCGNGHMMLWLKAAPSVELINFVDVDADMLDRELYNYFAPNLVESMLGRDTSEKPLDIVVYCGDLREPDDRLKADCFTMVEVIEHMLPEDVEVAMETVFGYYKPKRVIVTTPNSEFNHLLRYEDEPKDVFRHWDHKFEWNRAEFKDWADSLCQKFPYEVTFHGVGHLPESKPFGPCTQIAVFIRSETINTSDDQTNKQEETNQESGEIKESMKKLQTFHLIGKPPPKSNKTSPEKSFDWGKR